jgi:hypothetical protein
MSDSVRTAIGRTITFNRFSQEVNSKDGNSLRSDSMDLFRLKATLRPLSSVNVREKHWTPSP